MSRNAFLIRQGFLTLDPRLSEDTVAQGRNAFLIRQGFLT